MMYQSYYHEDGKAYFYGNEVSDYGREQGYVDYATLAKSFEAVLANDIIPATDGVCGYWEQISGFADYSEERDEINEAIEALEEERDEIDEEDQADRLEEIAEEIAELNERLEQIEDEENEAAEIFQYYIVSDNAVEILEAAGEIVFCNDTLGLYVWGVTHYGTAWSYVLTDIKIGSYENWKKWLAGEAEEAA